MARFASIRLNSLRRVPRLPPTAAEDRLEIFTRRYESGAILLSSTVSCNIGLRHW
jgi:hypothetical protein